MKKVFLSGFFLLISIAMQAQDQAFAADAKKLVKLSVDTSQKAMMRNTLTYNVDDEKEKEDIVKTYDAVVYKFLGDIEQYYLATYTHDEVKKMLEFYETPTGKKFIKEKKKLVDGNFPPGKEWDMEEYKREKNKKEGKPEEPRVLANTDSYDAAFKKDVLKLMDLMGVPEQVDYKREYTIIWSRPDEEKEAVAEFETTVPEFLKNSELHFLTKYTHEEVKEIIRFYETPVGKKLVDNNKNYIDVYQAADDVYSDAFTEIHFAARKNKK